MGLEVPRLVMDTKAIGMCLSTDVRSHLVQGACLQAGQLDMAAPSLAAAVSNGTISPSLVVPVPRPTPIAAVPTGETIVPEVRAHRLIFTFCA